jgi:serine/threonine protein kinase
MQKVQQLHTTQQQPPQKRKREQPVLPIGASVRNVNGDAYTVEALLGEGGSSAVYEVRDRHRKEDVFALKELIDPDRTERERFAFEAEVLMRLDHYALPHVYRVFENEKLKRIYILMDYIEGRDLEALRQEESNKRFSLQFVLASLTPVIAALSYLHHCEPPIVHRDIKPANIVIPIKAGDAMLVDFGIAKEYVNDGTTSAIRHGTRGYAALEQYGSGTNVRTDIYGLGATIYTLLTGIVPVDAFERVAGRQGNDPLKPVHEVVPEISQGVSDVISRALSISRDDRYASIDEFWEELNAKANVEDVITEPVSVPAEHTQRLKKNITPTTLRENRELASKKRRRNTILAVLSTFVALLLLGVGITELLIHLTPIRANVPSAPKSVVRPSFQTTPAATPTISQAPYPTLAPSYKGTVDDDMNNTKTFPTLAQIVQNKSKFHGYYDGSDFSGPFDGTVDTNGNITFLLKLPGRNMNISFEGNVKTGGSMAGEFYVLDPKTGQRTGEYGQWTMVQG